MRIEVLPHITSRYNWLIDIFCLTTILFVFYTLWLGHYPLFTPDEGRYSEVAREMIATNDYVTPRVDGVAFLDKPILYYWLQVIAIKLFGLKEWALRFFPMLLGVLGCLVTYVCGRHLFDRRTGLVAAIILATTPLYFGGAHYANLDLEVAVLISCTLLFFMAGVQSQGKPRSYFLFTAYIFAAGAFLTKGMIAFAFPSLIFGAWIILLNRWDILKKIHLLSGLVLFLVIVLPWYILVQKANPEFLHYFFVTQQVSRFLSNGEFNNPTPVWFYAPIVLLGFFPWTIFAVQAICTTVRNIRFKLSNYQNELFLLLWFIIIFAFFSIPRSKTIGYILPVFPALALLVGNYLSKRWGQIRRFDFISGLSIFIMLGLVISSALIALPHYNWIDLSANFKPYLYMIAAIIFSSVITALFLAKKMFLSRLFFTGAVCSTLCLLTLTLGAVHLNGNSAKTLAVHLRTIIAPEDEVITYFKYYQDIPLYLEKRITIVTDWNSPTIPQRDNWARELWYGMPFQKTEDWLISENKFWERWNSSKRVFVFINANYLHQFQEHTKDYFLLGKSNDIILLSNRDSA